jgi:hypothetical protein
MKKTYKDMLPYILGGGALLAIYLIFFKRDKAEVMEENALEEEASGGSATYPDSQFYAWANKLEQAMFDLQTNEDSVYDVFRFLRNNNDFVKLKQAFGIRNYTGGWVPGFLSPDLSLDGWIEEELDPDEIDIVNSILQSKGITYRF